MAIWSSKQNNHKCTKQRDAFIECVLKNAECIKNGDCKTFEQALLPNHFPEECDIERQLLYLCRRSYMDRRSRLRGTNDYREDLNPSAVNNED